MPRDPGLAFSQNLVQNFIRFKMFQMQEEREARRDERYMAQLQANQRFRQQQSDIQQEQFKEVQGLREDIHTFRKEQAVPGITMENIGALDEFTGNFLKTNIQAASLLDPSFSPGGTSVGREKVIRAWEIYRDAFKSTLEGQNASDETMALVRQSFWNNIQKRNIGSFQFGAGGGEYDMPSIDELGLSGNQGTFLPKTPSSTFPSEQKLEDMSGYSIEELRRIAGGQ